VKGLIPSLRERPFTSTRRLSRCGKRRVSAYIVLRPVCFPKPISPAPIRRRDGISARRSWLLRITIWFFGWCVFKWLCGGA